MSRASYHARLSVIAVTILISGSYLFFFYLEYLNQENAKKSIFEEYRTGQVEATKNLARHIGSDIELVSAHLGSLAKNQLFYDGDLSSPQATALAQETYGKIGHIVDRLCIADKDNIIRVDLTPQGQDTVVGADLSGRDYVKEVRATLQPGFSDVYQAPDGKYRVAIAYPMVDKDSTQYAGFVVATFEVPEFFARYGNIYDIDSQFLVVLDSKGNYLAAPVKELIGRNAFGDEAQRFISYDKTVNDHHRMLLSGKSVTSVYDYGIGERLNTAEPVYVDGKPEYFVEVITPASEIYSQVGTALANQMVQMLFLLSASSAAVGALAFLLARWNKSLQREVKNRTRALEDSHKELEANYKKQLELASSLENANKKLKQLDEMRDQFISIASHELRNPIQPILISAELARRGSMDKDRALDIVFAEGKGLKQLANDILDVSRIDSNRMVLEKEKFGIGTLIEEMANAKRVGMDGNRLSIEVHADEDTEIEADKAKIGQVLANLLSNSLKFTEKGTIKIEKRNLAGQNKIEIIVSDTGKGIPPEIMPNIFGKFATKKVGESNKHGTGLGLYICKAIISAHGGEISASNNESGGATFRIVLPT